MCGGLERSERGTLFPQQLPLDFRRHAPAPEAARLVRWWWSCSWNVPPGRLWRQRLLPFPGSNLAAERELIGFAGPTTGASHRDLAGRGRVVGALLQPAAIPAFTDDIAGLRDRYVALPEPGLFAELAAAGEQDPLEAVRVLQEWLLQRVGAPEQEGLLANEMVRLCEQDREIRSLEDAARALSVSVRTLHRLAARYVGLTPYAIIRRRRLQDAAHRLRREPRASIARIAAEAGFADHAHFAREFRRVLGDSPAGYRRATERAAEHAGRHYDNSIRASP